MFNPNLHVARCDVMRIVMSAKNRGEMCQQIMSLPEEDLVRVIHAKWTEHREYNGDYYYTCSNCNEDMYFADGDVQDNLWNYCPVCGAKMEETVRIVEEVGE